MCCLVNELFGDPSHTVTDEPRLRKRARTRFSEKQTSFGSCRSHGFSAKKSEELHFKLKATITARGFTCLLCADSMWTEMAAFAYSLCSTPPSTGTGSPVEVVKVEASTPFYGNLVLFPRLKAWFPFNSTEVNSGCLGQAAEFISNSPSVHLY